MIQAEFYCNDDNNIIHFNISGHAGYDNYGKDIVCAAVSMLVINTINSIGSLTDAVFKMREDEERGEIDFIVEKFDDKAFLLLDSLRLGLENIQQMYEDYLSISIRREP